ncbi:MULTISPECIES: alpha/beta hydrolase [Streptomyces]|uniref:Enterochelin esterase-like enzyme n=1 Tax=Streptomyces clavifer TaxID=68188 RepID=A0ABS4V9L8_9ACTN|nr:MULTISPECIES: alpha/beta hydrolase-fold protein [Streptomyces]MBP2360629.1 enterochelin esterase-like enzyme [Streptomyces clavifer]MDX2743778.1 alpha/beta hydrolase-fold protein [Streptomyces sp. NRRL_B-2557]GHB00475.1 esterase [Streptomyces clavifer]
MGLTGTPVLVVAAALASGLFAATLLLWPRLAGRTARAVAGRTALLLSTQLALFVAAGLLANHSFLFYGSWADLLGREQELGTVTDHGAGKGASGGVVRIGTVRPDAPGAGRPASGGRIDEVVVSGRASGIDSRAYVYLPPEYFQQAHAGRTFPAVIVLTGYPGTAENLFKGLRYPRTAHERVRAGRAQPMVLVMLRPTVAPPRDTECVDVRDGPQAETFFAEDLPRAVSRTYRVGEHARNWGVIGNSTGGYCALKLGLHHPERFAASAGLSAYYRAAEDPTTGDLFHGDRAARRRADLLWSLDHRPPAASSFLVTTSRQGEGNLRETREFIDRVRAPARVSSIVLDSGGHNFTTWRREIPPALEWMSGRLTAD